MMSDALDDVLAAGDLAPFDEGPPVRGTTQPQARGDERSDAWRKLSAHPPKGGQESQDRDDDE